MSGIVVLPHAELCPAGAAFDATAGQSLCDALLAHGIDIEHACEQSGACATCHVIVREGFDLLAPADENEEDRLDSAWGLAPTSRLSCQAMVPEHGDLVIEIPRYSINHAKEKIA